VADEEFDGPDVILDLLGERQGITDEARQALPQSIVEALDAVGFGACFVIALWRAAGMTPRYTAYWAV